MEGEVMELENERETQRQVEEILLTDEDPIAKVQDLVDIGFEEETANDIVERYQIGQSSVIYYEQLPQYRDEIG
jgi:hypothetical protein